MPTDTIAIMMPKSMTFTEGPSAPYTAVTEETTAQTYVARSVAPSQTLDFTVAGSGQMPRDTEARTAGTSAQPATGTAATDTRPGGGLGVPLDPEGKDDPWAKYKWWILGALGLIMAVGAGIMLKSGPKRTLTPLAAAPLGIAPNALLTAMKEELFALETDKLQGRLSETEYAEQKTALEVVLRRALLRSEPVPESSNPAGPDV
jgi:hypothetical protein